MATVLRSTDNMERKNISISVKRQITIPQKYFEILGFGDEAICELRDDGIFIRPVHNDDDSFSEEILADLIAKGLSGDELLASFKEERKKIRSAVSRMIDEADKLASSDDGKLSLDELFGAEE